MWCLESTLRYRPEYTNGKKHASNKVEHIGVEMGYAMLLDNFRGQLIKQPAMSVLHMEKNSDTVSQNC